MASQLERLEAAVELLAAAQQDCDRLRAENAELLARLNAAGVAAARLGVLTLRAAQERDALLEACQQAEAFIDPNRAHLRSVTEEQEWRGRVLHALRAALAAVALADAP